MNDGKWHHIVVTWASARGEWKLYKDGVILDSGSDLSTSRPVPGTTCIKPRISIYCLDLSEKCKDSGEGVFFNNQHIKKLILHCKIVPSTPISGKGILVIGQEQDSLGGDFSSTEAFIGTLTLFNMWDRELPLSDVENMMVSCQDFHGNVISWQEVQKAMHGGVSAQPSTFCQGKVY